MSTSLLFYSSLCGFLALAVAHSQMTQPQSTSPQTCRLGGEPQFGIGTCEGPCDLRAIEGGYANFASPDTPAAVYRRGDMMRIKYARNNHGPGGFVRLTLVRPEEMMDKAAHKRNAFYYSCWGAKAVEAGADELAPDQYGFGFIGSDGQQHDTLVGYYITDVKIPEVVPDGKYVLGWVWFGGTGTRVESMEPEEPSSNGYFSDYWSCSFVEISGGAALVAEYTPVFNNDMTQFSPEGCMSANDEPGVCSYEPCRVEGSFQQPKTFKNGTPPTLTPAMFGGEESPASPEVPVETPDQKEPEIVAATPVPVPVESPETEATAMVTEMPPDGIEEEVMILRRTCRCIAAGSGCWPRLAELTANYCIAGTDAHEQPTLCRESCCKFCASGARGSRHVCAKENVMRECRL